MRPISSALFHLYRFKRFGIRPLIRRVIKRIEGGDLYSLTLRRIFKEYHKVEIGLYTDGSCFEPWVMDKNTTIGRYCSIASGVRAMNRNHPMDHRSTHALFFNPRLGIVNEETLAHEPLEIGHDVWIGANAVIHPNVRTIGTGAVVGAGAVLARDVPPYAIVVGNPARVVRFRFPDNIVQELLESRWWEQPIEELDIHDFNKALSPTCSAASRKESPPSAPSRPGQTGVTLEMEKSMHRDQ